MRSMSRVGALVASATLALSGLAAAAPAQAATDPAPADAAATWLSGQLTGGLMHNPNWGGFDDYGLSIDTALALDAIGGHAADVQAIRTAIAAHVTDYISYAGDFYAGSVAKAAVLAQVTGADPRAFGGTDLITTLEGRVGTAAPVQGRLRDSGTDDYSNAIGQALGARALTEAGSAQADDVRAFLLAQQCSEGYFRLNFATPDAVDQTCDGGKAAGKSPADNDVTSYAVLMLANQTSKPGVASAITKAKAYLVAHQQADGSFGGGVLTEAGNANSTGLAAWALGDTPASAKAAVWLRAHQVAATQTGALATSKGAMALNDAALTAGQADGITDDTSDQWRRATSQGAPGLKWLPAAALQFAPVTGYRKAGTRMALSVTGARAGDQLCLTGATPKACATATTAPWSQVVTLPAGTGNRGYTVTDADGNTSTATVQVLDRATLALKAKKAKVRRNKSVSVTVRGLAPGERVAVRVRGKLVRTATASPQGTFTTSVKVGRKRGKAVVAAYGAFGDIRHGRTVVRVR